MTYSRLPPPASSLLIIGAGPAGLMCAIRAARRGLRTFVLEKNVFPGKKLLISGSGQCNVTHSGEIEDFFTKYGSREKSRFVKPALLHFTNRDLYDFFSENGLWLAEDEKGKLFPESRKSRDVLDVLLQEAKKTGVQLETAAKVQEISRDLKGNGEFLVKSTKGEFRSPALVFATGGKSYPATGSTGDGFTWASALGHTIEPPRPSLAPAFVKNYPFSPCSGISVPETEITLLRAEKTTQSPQFKKIHTKIGPVLLTHKNLSGPGILDFSRFFRKGDLLRLNWLGSCSTVQFERKFLAALVENGKRSLGKTLRITELPERFVRNLLETASISPEKQASQLEKTERKKIASLFTAFELEIESVGDFSEAMCTAGGVSLAEVDRQRLMSRIVPNLYFCGEVLDIDGDTGGYNLQFAFSSGALVGDSIE